MVVRTSTTTILKVPTHTLASPRVNTLANAQANALANILVETIMHAPGNAIVDTLVNFRAHARVNAIVHRTSPLPHFPQPEPHTKIQLAFSACMLVAGSCTCVFPATRRCHHI